MKGRWSTNGKIKTARNIVIGSFDADNGGKVFSQFYQFYEQADTNTGITSSEISA
jgi:hypothetical protein